MSPPFPPWTQYYLVPSSLIDKIRHLALGSDSKDAFDPKDVKIDLSDIAHLEADELYMTTNPPEWKVEKTAFWHLREGAIETEDYMFISAAGWEKLRDW